METVIALSWQEHYLGWCFDKRASSPHSATLLCSIEQTTKHWFWVCSWTQGWKSPAPLWSKWDSWNNACPAWHAHLDRGCTQHHTHNIMHVCRMCVASVYPQTSIYAFLRIRLCVFTCVTLWLSVLCRTCIKLHPFKTQQWTPTTEEPVEPDQTTRDQSHTGRAITSCISKTSWDIQASQCVWKLWVLMLAHRQQTEAETGNFYFLSHIIAVHNPHMWLALCSHLPHCTPPIYFLHQIQAGGAQASPGDKSVWYFSGVCEAAALGLLGT